MIITISRQFGSGGRNRPSSSASQRRRYRRGRFYRYDGRVAPPCGHGEIANAFGAGQSQMQRATDERIVPDAIHEKTRRQRGAFLSRQTLSAL